MFATWGCGNILSFSRTKSNQQLCIWLLKYVGIIESHYYTRCWPARVMTSYPIQINECFQVKAELRRKKIGLDLVLAIYRTNHLAKIRCRLARLCNCHLENFDTAKEMPGLAQIERYEMDSTRERQRLWSEENQGSSLWRRKLISVDSEIGVGACFTCARSFSASSSSI